jgi:tetratricopeptide (TPR) repeat protein
MKQVPLNKKTSLMKFLPPIPLRKRNSNVVSLIPLILFFLTLFVLPISAELLSDAAAAEDRKDYGRAFSLYTEWLEKNTAHPDYFSILIHTAQISPRLSDAVNLLRRGLEENPSDDIAKDIYFLYADLLEMSGGLENASLILKQLHALGGEKSLSALLRAAVLEFELGETAQAEKDALIVVNNAVASELILDASFLLSRIYLMNGREERGFTVLDSLTDTSVTVQHIKPEYLYALILYAEQYGRTEEAETARRKLQKYFPDSVYIRLDESSDDIQMHLMPNPSLLLGGNDIPRNTQPAQTEDNAEPEGKKPAYVQTGSFSVKENAEYMKRDLEESGFCAVIRNTRVSGERYYQVLVPLKPQERVSDDCTTDESADTVLILLKERGFEGFLVF